MDYSASVRSIWGIAAAEAQFLKSKEIEPEHYVLGFLKLEDLLGQDALFEKLSGQDRREALSELGQIVDLWKRSEIDCKRVRRRLRYFIQEEQGEDSEFDGHRSTRSREMFAEAEENAGNDGGETVSLATLFEVALKTKSEILDALFKEFKIDLDKLLAAQKSPERTIQQEDEPEWLKDSEPAQAKAHPLAQYGRDLTLQARKGKLGPIIGRDAEIKDIARVLTQRTRSNPLLIGDPGVGKTAVVEGLALFAIQPEAPQKLQRFYFVEITISALISGTSLRGQFEKRLEEVIEAAREDPDLVLFVDEIHTMMSSGGLDTVNAANILKPVLARGEMRMIGATTTEEYRKHIEPDGAIARRFQTIWIDEPSSDETMIILKGLRPKFQKHHQIIIDDDVIQKAVDLSSRYINEGFQPDKAIMVLDEACARRKLLTIHSRNINEQTEKLEINDVGEVIARRTNMPIEVILMTDEERLLDLDEALSQRVIGQEQAVNTLARGVRISRAGLRAPNKPSVFLFAGPTGTGKTELAKALAESLFFSESCLITLDMSEYQQEHSVSKLIGSPPGYVGFGEEPMLIREVRKHPYSVILLDEIEKAHPAILTIFLQVFDEGRLTDSRGRKINFSESIIIMTSNLGATVKPKRAIGFEKAKETVEKEKQEQENYQKQVQNAIVGHMPPELINRIQDMVVFQPLSRETVFKILEIFLKKLNQQLTQREISVQLDESAKELLMEHGYSPVYGARHLQRAFEHLIYDSLSQEILGGNVRPGEMVEFKREGEKLRLDVVKATGISTTLIDPDEGLTM
jgi:ATP-dependent Clp protease ATP-binding subunit ClpC